MMVTVSRGENARAMREIDRICMRYNGRNNSREVGGIADETRDVEMERVYVHEMNCI